MHVVPALLLLLLALIAAYTDLRWSRLPNTLTFGAAALGLAANLALSGIDGLGLAALGYVLGVAFLAIPWLMRGMAAGDVKLLAAVGAIGGPSFLLPAFLAAAILGGAVALVILVLSGRLLPSFANALTLGRLPTLVASRQAVLRIPYGAVIAVGVLFTLVR